MRRPAEVVAVNVVSIQELSPLPRGYTREPAVEEEIRRLAREGAVVWTRISDGPEQPRLETLVYCIRDLVRRGDIERAWEIADGLVKRVSGCVARALSRQPGLSRDQIEEVLDDLVTGLYGEWLSLDPAQAFWEVRFQVCLKRKLLDALKRHRRVHAMETDPVRVGSDGEERNLLEEAAEPCGRDPLTMTMVATALGSLREPERTAFYLRHYAGWSEGEIAVHLHVTDRSVRNYLRRADQLLSPWRDSERNDP